MDTNMCKQQKKKNDNHSYPPRDIVSWLYCPMRKFWKHRMALVSGGLIANPRATQASLNA